MSYTKKVAFNTAAQFVGKIAGIGVSLVTIGILFRFLGVEGSGKYTTTFAFTSFFSLFADLGLGWTLLRELSIKQTKEEKTKVFQNIVTIRIMLGVVVFAIAAAIVWLFNYPADVKMAVGILSIAWFFQSLTSNVVQVYLNSYRMDIAVSAEVVGKALILLCVYLASTNNGNLNSVMLAYLAGCFANFVIVWAFAGRFVKTGLAFDKEYWHYALRQAIPIGITLVFGYIYYKVDSLMLSLMKGMTDVGIYGAPYKLLEVLQMFPALFLGASFSLVTKYVTEKDERVHSAFQKEFDFLSLIALPIVAGTFVLAMPIIKFVTGSGGEFLDASTVTLFGHSMTAVTCLKILIFSVGINFFSNLYGFMLVSLGKQKQMLWPTVGFALFNVVLNATLIPKYSYIGASCATLVTELIVMLTTYYVSRKNVILPVKLADFFKMAICALAMGLATYAVYALTGGLFLSIFVAIIVYVAGVIICGVIPQKIINKIIKFRFTQS